jgi:hypothetical protein
MSGSDQDLIKDLEEDVVETQGTVRYKQAANVQDPDDDSDFEEYYEEVEADKLTGEQIASVKTGEEVVSGIDSDDDGDLEEDYWEEGEIQPVGEDSTIVVRHRLPIRQKKKEEESEESKQSGGTIRHKISRQEQDKPRTNLVVKLLEKNPLGMTLPEMAGGTRKQKRIKTLRPMLSQAIKEGQIMPVSQRAGHTVYRLVKHIGSR